MMANSRDDIASCYFSTHINNTVYEVFGKWHEIHNEGGAKPCSPSDVMWRLDELRGHTCSLSL